MKVQVDIGSSIEDSYIAGVFELDAVPRIGEAVAFVNHKLRVVDILHFVYHDDPRIVVILTSGLKEKDIAILEKAGVEMQSQHLLIR